MFRFSFFFLKDRLSQNRHVFSLSRVAGDDGKINKVGNIMNNALPSCDSVDMQRHGIGVMN